MKLIGHLRVSLGGTMTKDSEILLAKLDKTHDLIGEMREDLNKRFGVIELAQQRLRYYIYGVAVSGLILLGKPEMVSAFLKF